MRKLELFSESSHVDAFYLYSVALKSTLPLIQLKIYNAHKDIIFPIGKFDYESSPFKAADS